MHLERDVRITLLLADLPGRYRRDRPRAPRYLQLADPARRHFNLLIGFDLFSGLLTMPFPDHCLKPLNQIHFSISRQASLCTFQSLSASSSSSPRTYSYSVYAPRLPRPRPFHSTTSSQFNPKIRRATKMIGRGLKAPAQQGMKSRVRTMPASEFPSDLGLLPELLIRPRNKDSLPSWFKRPWDRLKFEIFCVRDKIRDPIMWVSQQTPPFR